jgi:hypothetical protein
LQNFPHCPPFKKISVSAPNTPPLGQGPGHCGPHVCWRHCPWRHWLGLVPVKVAPLTRIGASQSGAID